MLGLPKDLISVHFLQKGNRFFDEEERQAMAAYKPSYIFMLDQGSSESAPVIDGTACRSLVIDHHWAPTKFDFPRWAEYVTACHSPPVATSSLLTYYICSPLHEQVPETCSWLCAIGTYGDLSNSFRWEPPFPDMGPTFQKHGKSSITKSVSLLNAPRRAASYNVRLPWDVLVAASSPMHILANQALEDARKNVAEEMDRVKRAAPKFSADGRVAVIRVTSAAQVHPMLAMQWANTLNSPNLKMVLAANDGYIPGKVNFSCRLARCARRQDAREPIDIILILQEYAQAARDPSFRIRLGNSFANGHKHASGGVVPTDAFEEFLDILQLETEREKKAKAKAKSKSLKDSNQPNTLDRYFKLGSVVNTNP